MKRLIITTIILLIAAVGITVIYFKNLNPQAQQTNRIIHNIPGNAAIIFEFNNDDGFYDIFKDNQLFASIIGKRSMDDLDTLRQQFLLNPALVRFFTGQNIFISLHPFKNNSIDWLLTTSASKEFKTSIIDELAKQQNSDLLITAESIAGKKGYVIYSKTIKKRFYLINKDDDIFSGSFSKEVIIQCIQNDPKKNNTPFVLLPDQQNANSLANLYVNYSQLDLLFAQFFTNKNTAIFKSFRSFSGSSALSLNFKNNALMFSGLTDVQKDMPEAYLDLFIDQQPVVSQLKNIFPSSLAYSIAFGVSNTTRFNTDLSQWQINAKMLREKDSLFKKVKAETGINLIKEFDQLLGNEFAVVTTRYQEKFGIILVKDGSNLKPILDNISTKLSDNTGQFNYNKLPFFLLGDAFNVFRRPYYMILDNYLVLANSTNELASYYDSYIKRKFLNKIGEYNQFDNLLAERSNIAWLINFKNTQAELKRDMNTGFYTAFETNEPGWKNYYSASLQLASSGKLFYTNFCMNLNLLDTTDIQNQLIVK